MDRRLFYLKDGYCHVKGLLPTALLDEFWEEYRRTIVPSKKFFFRKSNRIERNKFTRERYVSNAFLNVHAYDREANESDSEHRFSRLARDIFCAEPVKAVLKELSGFDRHGLIQSMLFDVNNATAPHHDGFYLDSVPAGHITGAWFALEDIPEAAGRFYVVSGSHEHDLKLTDEERQINRVYQKRMWRYLETFREDVFAPELKKGDVLFFNSRLVHGALPTKDRSLSRRSLTAHYLPDGLVCGRSGMAEANWTDFGQHRGMNYTLYRELPHHFPHPWWKRMRELIYQNTVSVNAHPLLTLAMRKIRSFKAPHFGPGKRDSREAAGTR